MAYIVNNMDNLEVMFYFCVFLCIQNTLKQFDFFLREIRIALTSLNIYNTVRSNCLSVFVNNNL